MKTRRGLNIRFPAFAGGFRFQSGVLVWLLKWLLWLLFYAWNVLFFAIGSALLLGFLPGHASWYIGAAVALVGFPFWPINVLGKRLPHPSWLPVRHSMEIPPDPAAARDPNRPAWVTRAAVIAGFWGIGLGLVVGFGLAMAWFSIAMSPFAPADWAASLTAPVISPDDAADGIIMGPGTRHPLPFILFLGPPAVLWLVGFVLGGLRGELD